MDCASLETSTGLTLRQSAVIAGLAYLLNPVSFAEAYAYPRLVISGNIQQTVQNITNNHGLFVAAVFCYLLSFIGDIVIAWALYYLLAPVNKAVSLLASLFQLIYTAMALVATLNLVHVVRILSNPSYAAAFGLDQLHAQVQFLLGSFQWDWSMSLLIFGIHLILLGCLVYLSSYIPRIIGAILVIDGLAWIIDTLQPYLFPHAQLKYLSIAFFGELVFMFWLLIRGWKIHRPVANFVRTAPA